MIDFITHIWASVQDWLFETLILPLVYTLGLMTYAEDAFDWVEFVMLGVVQVVLTYLLMRPLEAIRPAEKWDHRRYVRADVTDTLISRLGVLPLFLFVLIDPLSRAVDGVLRMHDIVIPRIDSLVPYLRDHQALLFVFYLVVLDFSEYWMHRLQHRFQWWWALHSVHHNQTQMSLWSDDRTHVFDEFLQSLWFAGGAILLGVPPAQFPLLVLFQRLVASISHANVRLSFGGVGDRLLVSPSFHRTHHGIRLGYEGPKQGCNFATVFPIWDLLFGTAHLTPVYPRTGVAGQAPVEPRGLGYLQPQVSGAKLLARTLFRRVLPAGRSRPKEARPIL